MNYIFQLENMLNLCLKLTNFSLYMIINVMFIKMSVALLKKIILGRSQRLNFIVTDERGIIIKNG